MSLISSMLNRGLSTLAKAEGSAVQYATGAGWANLDNALWHQRQSNPEHDDERGQEVIVHMATLTWPLSGPSLNYGALVRQSSSSDAFRVVVSSATNQHRQATIERREVLKYSADRGGTR